MNEEYALLHLAARYERNWNQLVAHVAHECKPLWSSSDVSVWGQFSGLFGLASNELYLLLHNPNNVALESITAPLDNIRVVKAVRLQATARPTSFAPLKQGGLYVFRTFRLQRGAVEQTVKLSRQAWETFENSIDYIAQAQGLFQELGENSGDDDNMLLLTWYDGFESWEKSRNPKPAARDNFAARQALTTRTGAIATRLIGTN